MKPSIIVSSEDLERIEASPPDPPAAQSMREELERAAGPVGRRQHGLAGAGRAPGAGQDRRCAVPAGAGRGLFPLKAWPPD